MCSLLEAYLELELRLRLNAQRDSYVKTAVPLRHMPKEDMDGAYVESDLTNLCMMGVADCSNTHHKVAEGVSKNLQDAISVIDEKTFMRRVALNLWLEVVGVALSISTAYGQLIPLMKKEVCKGIERLLRTLRDKFTESEQHQTKNIGKLRRRAVRLKDLDAIQLKWKPVRCE